MNKTKKKFWRIVAFLGLTAILIILGKHIYEEKHINALIHSAATTQDHANRKAYLFELYNTYDISEKVVEAYAEKHKIEAEPILTRDEKRFFWTTLKVDGVRVAPDTEIM